MKIRRVPVFCMSITDQKMKGDDNFSFCGSSLNDISLHLKQIKLGFTAGRYLILYALVRAKSPLM